MERRRSQNRGKSKPGHASKQRNPAGKHKSARRSSHRGSPKLKSEGTELIRLNKVIAHSGLCSRRAADDLIRLGQIKVNGKVVTEMGLKISPSDTVKYNSKVLTTEKMVYILMNKPKDHITTASDDRGRRTVLDLIGKSVKERVVPVGRLDRNTTGLLLLTNDGELTKKLTHPRYGIKKVYHITLNKNLKAEDMRKIAAGVKLDDGKAEVDVIAYVGDGADKKLIGIELHSGKNRIIRRIFEHLEYEVTRLDRILFAGLTKKDVPRGKWRFLKEKEIGMLMMTSGK